MLKYSIGICTYNRCEMVRKCVENLVRNVSYRDDYEIIVIDNNSNDETFNYIKIIDGISLYSENNQGLSYARNRFVKESKGDYLLFLDDDAIISDDILSEYDVAIGLFDKSVVFGGRVLPEENLIDPKWFNKSFHMAYSILDNGSSIKYFKKPYGPIGANFLVKKSAIKDNLFRTDLGRVGNSLLSGEETDFISKIDTRQHWVYVGSACVNHHFGHERYTKEWAEKRFSQNGVSDFIMRKENNKIIKGFASQVYHFISSMKEKNKFYSYCRYKSIVNYVSCMVKLK